jgi:hypothetical protein
LKCTFTFLARWANLAQKLVDKEITLLVQELGAIPGKNISPAGDGGFLISDALMNKIGTLNRSKEDRAE